MFCQTTDTVIYKGDYSFKVDSIVIRGNEKTNAKVILRELTFQKGDMVNSKILTYNKNRVYSLGIFTNIFITPERINNINYVIILVRESWYIYPIPYVELQDQDWEKISYGIDLGIRNLGGLNATLRARVGFGYDPVLLIHYDYPYLIENQNIDLSIDVLHQKAKNKSVIAKNIYGSNFNQKIISASVDLGKRFGLYNRADLFLGYDYIETPFYIKGISASSGRIDRVPSLGISYTHDTRDLIQFPSNGLYTYLSLMFKGLGFDGINYKIANIDFREYRLFFSNLIAKWRFAGRFTFGGLVPFYNYSFLGYQERIRGYYTTEMEGNDSYLGSVELNYPLLKDMDVSLNFIPIIPKSLLSYRIALYLELFTDSGTTLFKGQKFSLDELHTGYGTGLTFLLLPYNSLRIEYAFNEYKRAEWIAALGISF